MAAPSIRPIRNCLYGRYIGCTRRHSYQPVASARWRAGERSRSGGVSSVARRALTLLNAPLVRYGFGAKSTGPIRRKYPNALCCMKTYTSHKSQHVFYFADFLFVNKQDLISYVNLCDKKYKMKFGLIAQL